MHNLTPIRDISFEELFDEWRKNEAKNPDWIHCATDVKGWPDWESWRRNTLSLFGAEKRQWKIYSIDDQMEFIPKMLMGPFNGWQAKVPEHNKYSFEEMLALPENLEFYSHHGKVLDMIKNFPAQALFTGVIREKLGKVVCIEGHHRATAISLAKVLYQKIEFGQKLHIALTTISEDEDGIFDYMQEIGTSKR